jgi:3-oxoacyl-[acyl-carrier-protein] synthase-1
MATAVGLHAPAACAAIRVKLTNPVESRFVDGDGEWITAHSVPLPKLLRGGAKLAHMAAMVIDECLENVPHEEWDRIPLLLCLAEGTRPGRWQDERLFADIRELAGADFASGSLIVPQGRVSIALALEHARKLIYQGNASEALIVGTDSLLEWPALRVFEEQSRLLSENNTDGFLPGEAAAGILVGRPAAGSQLLIEGLGFATEPAPIESGEPLRAEGLTEAIRAALRDAGCEMHDLDFRITDISGEQYYFKEASLALTRLLRQRKEQFDLWHPAECIGETGSAIGPAMLVVAQMACAKAYAAGPAVLVHASNDAGQRAAIVARYRER